MIPFLWRIHWKKNGDDDDDVAINGEKFTQHGDD